MPKQNFFFEKCISNRSVRTKLPYNKFFFSKNLLAIEVKKIDAFKNKPVYLGLATLEISNTAIYELRYDYVKMKYREKTNCIIRKQIAS